MSNFRQIYTIAAIFAISYFLISSFSLPLANMLVSLLVVGAIPLMLASLIFKGYMYKQGINFVNKNYRINFNTIRNKYCTVQYYEDGQLIVMDNNANPERRMFTLTQKDFDVNKEWYRICKIFDGYTSLDSLAKFCNKDLSVEIVAIDPPKKRNIKEERQKLQEIKIKNVQPTRDTENVSMDTLTKITGPSSAELLNAELAEVEFFTMQDVLVSKSETKIDVNRATAAEIAMLPGVNIVMAKKIVEYRDLNGDFATFEDFITSSGIKEHFAAKIKQVVVVKPSKDSDSGEDNGERSVDI